MTGLIAGAAFFLPSASAQTADLVLKTDDTIIFLGDQIIEAADPVHQNNIAMLTESFLAVRYPDLRLQFINAGWEGDTASRALLRLERDVLSYNPSVVVVCLGLNDPDYLPFSEEKLAAFRHDLTEIVHRCRIAGATVWLISPPAVDEQRGRRVRLRRRGRLGFTDLKSIRYNTTLARYTSVIQEVAQQTECGFVDWFHAAIQAELLARRQEENVSYTADALLPNTRGHALGAMMLLKAWNARPIEVMIRADWQDGAVQVRSHAFNQPLGRMEITEAGRRYIYLQQLPLPWPMAGGKNGHLESHWEAAEMCRYIFRLIDPPPGNVLLGQEKIDDGTAIHLEPRVLRAGYNLAATEPLQSAEPVRELYRLIGTKNYYRFGTWRKLVLTPPRELELVEAHRELIAAWNSYVRGMERLIDNYPKRFDVTLVMEEAAENEELPISRPPKRNWPITRPPESTTTQPGSPATRPASVPDLYPQTTQPETPDATVFDPPDLPDPSPTISPQATPAVRPDASAAEQRSASEPSTQPASAPAG